MNDAERLPSYREVWLRIQEIHAMYASIDRMYTWSTWLFSIFRGLRSLFGFAAAGIFLQSLMQDMLKTGTPGMTTIVIATSGLAIIGLITIAGSAYGGWRQERFSEELKRQLEERRMRTLMSLDLGRLWDPAFVALKDRLGWRGMSAHRGVIENAHSIIAGISGVTVAFGILIILDPILIVLTLIPVIPSVLEKLKNDQKERAMWERYRLLSRLRRTYESVLSEERSVVQTKLVRSIGYIWNRYRTLMAMAVQAERELDWYRLKTRGVVQVVAMLCYVGAIFYVGMRMVSGTFSIAEIMLIAGSVQSASMAVASLASNFADIKVDALHYRTFVEYIDAKPSIDESTAGVLTLAMPPRITFDNVSFAYPGQETNALDDCSFHIAPCERVAIIGRNGSGKTTAMRMLAKVFLPKGFVRINGTPLAEITQDSLLEHLMYVTQDSQIPDLNLREIITACDAADVNHERLRLAARFVDCTALLDGLRHGLETMLDPSWPEGIDLSGGQRQRVKLIAAFYRLLDPQVQVGVFDEPMSHCDAETRELYYAALKSLRNKTIIVVAHDPLYLHHFERVIVMDKGRVIQDLRGAADIAAYRNELALSLSGDLFS